MEVFDKSSSLGKTPCCNAGEGDLEICNGLHCAAGDIGVEKKKGKIERYWYLFRMLEML